MRKWNEMETDYLSKLTEAFHRRNESPDGVVQFLAIAERAEDEIDDGTGNPIMISLLASQIRRGAYEDAMERNDIIEQVIGIFQENYL